MLLCPYVVGQAPVLSPQSRHTSRSTGQIACPLKGDRPLAGLQSAVLTRPVLKIPLNKPKLLYVGVQAAVKGASVTLMLRPLLSCMLQCCDFFDALHLPIMTLL